MTQTLRDLWRLLRHRCLDCGRLAYQKRYWHRDGYDFWSAYCPTCLTQQDTAARARSWERDHAAKGRMP